MSRATVGFTFASIVTVTDPWAGMLPFQLTVLPETVAVPELALAEISVSSEGRMSTISGPALFGCAEVPLLNTVIVYVTRPLMTNGGVATVFECVVIMTGGGTSSVRMVPNPTPSPRAALVGAVRLTRNVSSYSISVSPRTGTWMVWEVTPARKVSRPLRDS